MRRKKTPPTTPLRLQQALDWLAASPQEDALLDLVPLRNHVATIASSAIPVLHRLKIMELLQQRAERIDEMLVPMLLDVKLPLPVHLGTVARDLIGLRAELGETWLKLAESADPREVARVRRSRTHICWQGIHNLSRQFIAALLIAIPTPVFFWRNFQALYHCARGSVDPTSTLPAEMSAIDTRFKSVLALSAAQPEGLTPRETIFLAEYLESQSAATQIDIIPPDEAADWLWLGAGLDQPPVPLSRRSPADRPSLYFRFGKLAELAKLQLDQLNDGVPPTSFGLPLQAAGADYRNALERARQHWTTPRWRSFNRRPKSIPIEVCTQLSLLWSTLEKDSKPEPNSSAGKLAHTDWTLLNESPSGYAIVHVVGKASGIVPGSALGLRVSDGAAWQICLVRWARSNNSSHVEMGLEVLASSAIPVRIQSLARRNSESPIPALLLPAIPSLNRGEAILSGRGDYNARPFTLLQEQGASLQIVECIPHRSLVETASIEVFEFQRNRVAP
ncbi:MAG: hypothetical protein K9K30_16415 [Burkholderiaceae bacterium]|nr:hypothetical protein [Sulfuritalea sp.]MCF8176819.1 hypothetical protein [Burkholderiaceae bacterium]